MKRSACFALFAALAWADGPLVNGARKTEKAVKSTGGAVKDGASATVEGSRKAAKKTNEALTGVAAGTEKAAKATGKTVKKGAEATAEGAGKALDATGKGLSNLGKKISAKN